MTLNFAPEIPVRVLRDRFTYDPETGLLRFRFSRGSAGAGRIAGTDRHGYLVVGIDETPYPIHRVVWAMYYGEWPKDELDHINRMRDDNRIANLRVVTRRKNAANAPKRLHGRLKGTGTMKNGRWTAQIGVNLKKIHLGCYDTEQEAHNAYCEAAVRYFGPDYASFN